MSRQIRFYGSFEEASRQEADKMLKQVPVERLRETVDLILRVYRTTREELNRRPKSKKITFLNCP